MFFVFWVCSKALEISIEDLSTFVFDNLLTRPRLSVRFPEGLGKNPWRSKREVCQPWNHKLLFWLNLGGSPQTALGIITKMG